ncbi:hypothetical protein MUB15_33020 [Priestia sp. OVS21]|nr:hypothetical protein [Priestia sp. OVS21]
MNESEKVTLELTKEELMKFQRLMELHNEEEDKKSKEKKKIEILTLFNFIVMECLK